MLPIWTPKKPENSTLFTFWKYIEKIHNLTFTDYHDLHAWSIKHFPSFWLDIANFFHINFNTQPEEIFTKVGTDIWQNQWFNNATLNIADLMLRGREDKVAIIAINENQRWTLTYKELKQAVANCSAGLKACGVTKGDRVAAVMPNAAETVIAMLATASLGAIWSSCSPDFGLNAILDRFSQIKPKVIFICDGQLYGGKSFSCLDKITTIIEQLPSLEKLVLCPFINKNLDIKRDNKSILWEEFIKHNSLFNALALPFSHPLYIMFSSGTTGKPKCIVHAAGNVLLQHLKELGLHCNLNASDNLMFYTTCGWMMWNWMVSGLALGMTLTLYDCAPLYPAPKKLWETVAKEKVSALGVSAKYLDSLEQVAYYPREKHDLSSLKLLLSTGSPLLPKQFKFVYENIKQYLQLSSISGGTDIVSCFVLGNPMLPVYPGEIQCAGLGMDVHVFDAKGHDIIGAKGDLVCTTPFPSMPLGFWQDEDNKLYKKTYFSKFFGAWAQGDYAETTKRHTFTIYGRSDTTLNPKGVRIGTAEIYREIADIPEIIEAVVIGQKWEDDIRIVLFVKLNQGLILTSELQEIIKTKLRINASPRHVPDVIIAVDDIPKTFNGKIVEQAIKQAIEGEEIQNISSIVNPEALMYFMKLPLVLPK